MEVYDAEALDFIELFLKKMADTETIEIKKCFLIHNQKLQEIYQNHWLLLKDRWRSSPTLFNSKSWMSESDVELRKNFIGNLSEYAKQFSWNYETTIEAQLIPVVIPVLQGTSETAVWKICSGGFGTVSTVDDGYYGKGMYFTTNAKYSKYYSKDGVILMAFAIPGNVYPVTEIPDLPGPAEAYPKPLSATETLYGKPCKSGYQSHYVCVQTPLGKLGYPLQSWQENYYDELIVFQDAQVIPFCVLYI